VKMKYVSIDEVVAIHFEINRRFGGSDSIRDFGLLHSAVSRPRASFAGKDLYATLFDKAAALFHSLILNHSFVDGNKRTAYVATARFLILNGYILSASKQLVVSFVLKVIKEKLSVKEMSKWIEKHSNLVKKT